MANRRAKLEKEFANWYDQAGNRKPDTPKKTIVPVTPHPDEQVPARLAAVLMFPKAGSKERPDHSQRSGLPHVALV